jgi:hypothetical protein
LGTADAFRKLFRRWASVRVDCALDFSDHLSIISSPITGQYILNALDPARAQPPPCVPVLPAA